MPNPSLPRYLALERWLLQQIQQRRWLPGERLPSVRDLCRQKKRSKATVLHALQRLEAQGVVEARPRAGYFVLQPAPSVTLSLCPPAVEPRLQPQPVQLDQLLTDIMQRNAAFNMLPQRPLDRPPSSLLALQRCIGRALRQQSLQTHLAYDEPAGHIDLRYALARRYTHQGCPVDPQDITITSGCQQALFLALKACCQPGDLVAVESPGYYGVLQLLQALDLQVIEIPSSSLTGMDLSVLEQAAQQWPIRACVVTSYFATPTGASLPISQQDALLDLAKRQDFLIIEDDIYRELDFYHPPSPMKALDLEDRILLCGSFSKSLSRDLRLGWVINATWQQKIKKLKLITQLATSRFIQQGLADFLQQGLMDKHLRARRLELKTQRDQWQQAINQVWGQKVNMTQPEGGLCFWAEWPQALDGLDLYSQALQHRIVLTPGALFSTQQTFDHALRISFALPCTLEHQAALYQIAALMPAQARMKTPL